PSFPTRRSSDLRPPPRTSSALVENPSRRLQRCPQAVVVHRLNIHLDLFPRAGGGGGLAVMVHLQHEGARLGLAVTEVGLQHVRHVRHEVDRVVPHDAAPHRLHGQRGLLNRFLLRNRHVHSQHPNEVLGKDPCAPLNCGVCLHFRLRRRCSPTATNSPCCKPPSPRAPRTANRCSRSSP